MPVWHSVTVAFSLRRVSSSPSGRPTVTPRPTTVTRAPLTTNQIRGFWAAWGGWALDGMDSFIYALVLAQPTEEFNEEGAGATLANMREVDGALAGILATARRPSRRGSARSAAAG